MTNFKADAQPMTEERVNQIAETKFKLDSKEVLFLELQRAGVQGNTAKKLLVSLFPENQEEQSDFDTSEIEVGGLVISLMHFYHERFKNLYTEEQFKENILPMYLKVLVPKSLNFENELSDFLKRLFELNR
jgi:DMSO/TMAO reductase YedYZ molybdopterin-dependent catalytic subunit